MTTEAGFIALLEDLLAPVGPIRVKRMFGGAGIYAEGVMFAIVAGERVYFKTDEAGTAAFEDAGMGPFTYTTKSGTGVLKSFWQVPDLLVDEPDEFAVWATRAVSAARRGHKINQPSLKSADVPQRKPRERLSPSKGHRCKTTSGRRSPRA